MKPHRCHELLGERKAARDVARRRPVCAARLSTSRTTAVQDSAGASQGFNASATQGGRQYVRHARQRSESTRGAGPCDGTPETGLTSVASTQYVPHCIHVVPTRITPATARTVSLPSHQDPVPNVVNHFRTFYMSCRRVRCGKSSSASEIRPVLHVHPPPRAPSSDTLVIELQQLPAAIRSGPVALVG